MITIPDYIAAGLGLKSCELPEDELEGRMLLAGMTKGSDVFHSPLLMGLVIDAPRVFTDFVLPLLDTVDMMMLSRVNKKMCDVVVTRSGKRATKEEIFRVPTFVRSVALLRWARENGCPWDERTCAAAAAAGNLEVLQWAREHGCPWDKETCGAAAKGGHIEVLQWARVNGCPWNKWTCMKAADGGHREVLQWLRANNCPWDEMVCAGFAKGGHLELLQQERSNGCPWDNWTCTYAAHGGQLEVLKWARANGCPWDEGTCNGAAFGGYLEVLQWARVNGCPWSEDTCSAAARGGHFEVLKWARANGCPWDEDTITAADEGEHFLLLQWARANGCPAPRNKLADVTCAAAAADGSCLDVVNAVFKGPQGEGVNGINVQTVVTALTGRFTDAQVHEAVKSLVNDGHLYSTIDDEHFKSTLL